MRRLLSSTYNVGNCRFVMRFIFGLTLCAFVCLGQADQDAHARKNPLGMQPAAIDAGRGQFVNACAACHGANAEGGRGPNLAESGRLRRMTDDQLFNTVRRGIPGGGMPAFPLPDNTIWQIAAFLRSLNTPAFLVPVAGDARAGSELYRKAQCGSCHMIGGQGGFLGPDLTDIAASRTVKQLREAILKPGDKPLDGFAGVTVTLKSGERVTGIAKNYSDYSVDVLKADGSLHLLDISNIENIQFAAKSLMPDTYTHLFSSEDLQNLIAFLSRQTVRPDTRPDQKAASQEVH
ncbi:MAG TPA: c-type cytochrome [Bryobacteraceae bacterium]|nr:c-type cytochrome [Bryobacteraceae bacterium]